MPWNHFSGFGPVFYLVCFLTRVLYIIWTETTFLVLNLYLCALCILSYADDLDVYMNILYLTK